MPLTAPLPKGRGFLIQRTEPIYTEMQTGLTDSPKANIESPSTKMFLAALMSLSFSVLHSGQCHDRTSSGIDSEIYPQQLHRLEDGKNLSISTYVLPAQLALYASCLVNSPQLASAICLASFGFLIILFTAKFSAQTTWFSFISLRDNLCKLSILQSEILA